MKSKWVEDGGARGYCCIYCLKKIPNKMLIYNKKYKICPLCGSEMINGEVDYKDE